MASDKPPCKTRKNLGLKMGKYGAEQYGIIEALDMSQLRHVVTKDEHYRKGQKRLCTK